jgi:hypothetical protein
MGWACRRFGDEKSVQKYFLEIVEGKDDVEDLAVDGRIILKRMFKNERIERIRLAQNRNRRSVLVNVEANLLS